MRIERIRQQAMFALGLFEYLKQPLTIQAAIEDLTRRIDQRELAFLAMTKRLIYDQSQNPYRKLLRWAGCDYADLESLVKTRGLDRALESLRDAGVYITLEEFK